VNAATRYKSPLYAMTQTTPTCLWNDSASIEELTYSIEHGAVGATCNPVIAYTVLKKHLGEWRGRIQKLISDFPLATEDQIAWQVVEELSVRAAALLRGVFETHRGRNGRLSIQTDPRNYRNPAAILEQALRFNSLAPNFVVKIPVTAAGIQAIEEATYHGISINATVSFSVPQAIAVAEAVERGFALREKEGQDLAAMAPVCTIMVGRLDDWLKIFVEKNALCIDPGCLEWAGIAVFKRAYRIYRERGYRLRLLAAAYRNHMHWSELIGGDVVISPPYAWQLRFNASDVPVEPRMDLAIAPGILAELGKLEDFRRAYAENGLSINDFDSFPPTRRTLRQFIAACGDLNELIRELMLPNPDTESAI
jgi:transaldolase